MSFSKTGSTIATDRSLEQILAVIVIVDTAEVGKETVFAAGTATGLRSDTAGDLLQVNTADTVATSPLIVK